MSQTAAERQRERRNQGLCCSCSNQALSGKSRCQACTDEAKARYRELHPPKPKPSAEERRAAKREYDQSRYRAEHPDAKRRKVKPGEYDSRAAAQTRYRSFVAAGRCPGCRTEPRSATSVYCLACVEKQRAHRERRSAQRTRQQVRLVNMRRDDGLCPDCKSTELFRDDRCRLCWARQQAREGVPQYDARLAAGLCQRCDAVVEHRVCCEACDAKRRDSRRAAVTAGRCPDCGEEREAGQRSRCLACTEKKRQLYRDRRANRQCVGCATGLAATDKSHCPPCAVRSRAKCNRRYLRIRKLVIEAYGGKCRCCGEDRPEFLQIDHTNNDGAAHRRSVCGHNRGINIYFLLHRQGYPQAGFQLLCANCNYAKARYGECPHQRQGSAHA